MYATRTHPSVQKSDKNSAMIYELLFNMAERHAETHTHTHTLRVIMTEQHYVGSENSHSMRWSMGGNGREKLQYVSQCRASHFDFVSVRRNVSGISFRLNTKQHEST